VSVSAATSNIDDTKPEPSPGKPSADKRISNEAVLIHILIIHADVKHEYSANNAQRTRGPGYACRQRTRQQNAEASWHQGQRQKKFVDTTGSKYNLPIATLLLERLCLLNQDTRAVTRP